MNLIGHYACATATAAEVRLGSVVPDLASIYRRKVRALPLAQSWRVDRGADGISGLPALLAGVDFHHEVDRRFHRAPLFLELEAALAAALQEASDEPGLKRFLPAHVLAELFLDHLLLQGPAGLGAAFYRDLRDGRDLLATFIARHPQADRPSFERFVDHVVEDRFVDAYLAAAGIVGRMNRILVRFRQRPLGEAEQAAVMRTFDALRSATGQRLTAFVNEMRELAVRMAPPVTVQGQATGARTTRPRGWADPVPQSA